MITKIDIDIIDIADLNDDLSIVLSRSGNKYCVYDEMCDNIIDFEYRTLNEAKIKFNELKEQIK